MQTCKYLSVICAAALLGGAAVARAQETDAQAKAREALRQKMSELDAQDKQGKGAKSPAMTRPTPPPPVTPPPPRRVEKPTTPTPPPVAKPNPSPTPPPVVTKPTPPPQFTQPTPTPPPTAAPAQALPTSKEGKLAQLLAQYRADQISAEEYHKQRAAILADK